MEHGVRKIIHIDMDAFFASVEQRDNPELAGKPIAVGGSGKRGVVAAASYEARKFGVFSAMSSKIARQKCPDLIFVKPRFKQYKIVSMVIRSIFKDYTDLVEPLSLDEAFLDVTTNNKGMRSATLIAKEIKSRIKEQTGLTASAGVSINKFLAKIASDVNKPDGIFVIPPKKAQAYIEELPVDRFFGVGKVTSKKMKSLGLHKGNDLKNFGKAKLLKHFGKAGTYFYEVANGNDNRAVIPDRPRKSLGAENTFEEDFEEKERLLEELNHIVVEVNNRLNKVGRKGKTLTLKIKFADFTQITRSITTDHPIEGLNEITLLSEELFLGVFEPGMKIRLLGVTISGFTNQSPKNEVQFTIDF
jgi:DNA polymerase-4